MRLGYKFKTAVFDLDGTLIDKEKKFFPGVLEGFSMLKENGASLLLATGRNSQSIRDLITAVEFFECVDSKLICNDGNALYDYNSDELHIINFIPHKIVHKILTDYSNEASIIIESNGKLFSSSKESLLKYKFLYRASRNAIDLIGIEEMKKIERVTEIHLFSKSSIDLLEKLMLNYSDLGCYINNRFRSVKILPSNSCKAKGISTVLHPRGTKLENVVAFGDAENDISMLSNCGLGVAVKGCKKSLLEEADIKLDEDLGVFLQQWAKALQSYTT